MLNERTQPSFNDAIPDIRDIVRTLWRRRTLIAAVTVVTMVIGSLYIFSRPRMYEASSTILLEDSNINLADFKDVTAGAAFDDMTVQTEVKVLSSPSVAMQTINTLNLDKNPEFAGDNKAEILMEFMRHLNVSVLGTSRVIEVSFRSRSPELAAKVANAHVQSYFDSQIELKRKRVEQLSTWFEDKVKTLKEDVLAKSQAVEKFRAEQDLVTGKDEKSLVYQQISDTAAQLVPVEVHRYDVQSRLEHDVTGNGGRQPGAMTDVVNSPLIQTLKAQAATAAQELESLKATYGPNHPKLIAARNQLRQVNRAIAAETGNIKTSLKNDVAATQTQENLLKEKLGDLKTQSDELREKTITLNTLEVEQEASQKILDSFLANYQSIQSQQNFARPDAVVVSMATPPIYPAPPGKLLMLMALAVFAGCLSLAAVFVAEMMQGGLRNFDDVRKLGQRPLGVIPTVPNPLTAVLENGRPAYREAIKRIYMASIMNGGARTVLITSAMPGEGRTTFAVSMAYYLKSLGHKVIVIDADVVRPSLSRLTNTPSGPGFVDVLAGRAILRDAIDTDENGLPILRSGGQGGAFSPDLLQPARLRELIGQLKEEYAYILIDSSPLLAHSEATVMSPHVDGVIVVTEWMKTSQKDIGNMFASLRNGSVPVLGMVINKVDIDRYKAMTSSTDFLLPNMAGAA